jgi:hypothetical protein
MIKSLIYNYYYNQFMKENSKDKKDIDWSKWNKLDRRCESLSN